MRLLLAATLVLASLALVPSHAAPRPSPATVASTCPTCEIPNDDGSAAETRAPVLPTAAG